MQESERSIALISRASLAPTTLVGVGWNAAGEPTLLHTVVGPPAPSP